MPSGWPSRQPALPRPPLLSPAAPEQWRAPESVLGPLLDQPLLPAQTPEGLELRGAFNGPVYAMRRLHLRPWLRLDCRLGWYFDSAATCERLELEGRYRRCSIPAMRSLDGCGRTAAIGISTAVAWPEGGVWKALAAPMRARAMPQRTGMLHVIPSGMFAPPYSVIENVRRELEEEMGLELEPRRLRLAGVAVHALNLRPEICTVLLLRRRPAVRWNEEFAPRLVEVPLRPGLAPESLPGFFAPGAAALALAARLLAAPGLSGD